MAAIVEVVRDVGSFFAHLFDTSDFPARWQCGNWTDGHGWLHILSDLGVWSAYVAIPIVLILFVFRRTNLPFRFLFVLFGAFILSCGTTHLMEAIIFWWPAYRLAGMIKLFTALVSWATVIALIPIIPKALSMKSPEDLERTVDERTSALNREIAERIRAQRAENQQRELLQVTLSSIGDAVIATDTAARITFMNPIAAQLTGWDAQQARGRLLGEVFHIINEQTRQPVETPCDVVLREGRIVGLANHTVLVAKDGLEIPIDDSAAPIRDVEGQVFGVVLVFRDATEQRAHVEAQERLAAIVENSQDAIISQDLTGQVRSWNKGAQDLFGYTPEEVIGSPIEVIVPAELREDHRQSMQRLRSGEPVEYADTVRVRKDGTRLEVSSRISPIRDASGEVIGASKISHDVSERKRSERVLQLFSDAGTVLSALADEASMIDRLARLSVPLFADWCIVTMLDEQGRIKSVAQAHADPQKQAVLDELQARYPLDWHSASIGVSVLQSGQPELVSDVPESLLAAIARDASHRALIDRLAPRSMLTVPIVIRGRTVGTMQFVAAESGRRFVWDDIAVGVEFARRAAQAIENSRLYEELKEAQRQKDDFLAMLAHELRNPLAAIQYANHIATVTGGAPPEATETIDRQVKNLSRLIDDLLDVSRITRDKIHLKKEAVDGGLVARRAVASIRPVVEGRKHAIAIDVSADPMPLVADATRLEQILVNLLNNAAKYTPEGGRIELRAFPNDGHAVFQIKDNGIGIPTESLPHVFELFTQVDKSLDRSQGGLGIGLTVVRRLAEMHGGSVMADSAGLGHGSEFTVRIPLSDEIPGEGAASQPGLRASRPRRILVVDDNVDTAQSLATLLKLAGHEVQLAHDGQAALAAAHASHPAVIVLDIGLPGMDGYTVAKALRADGGFDGLRLVAVSGYGQPEDRRRAEAAGFDAHLVKPVSFEQLLDAIG